MQTGTQTERWSDRQAERTTGTHSLISVWMLPLGSTLHVHLDGGHCCLGVLSVSVSLSLSLFFHNTEAASLHLFQIIYQSNTSEPCVFQVIQASHTYFTRNSEQVGRQVKMKTMYWQHGLMMQVAVWTSNLKWYKIIWVRQVKDDSNKI